MNQEARTYHSSIEETSLASNQEENNLQDTLTDVQIAERACSRLVKDLLDLYVPTRILRSGSKHLLRVPRIRTNYCGGRAFSSCAPKHWNQLPSYIKQAASVEIFKKELKTLFFDNDIDFLT